MTRITAVTTQKGGTGKTTTAQALATGLNLAGYSALAIDADPQGNLTYAMGAENREGLYEAMKGKRISDLIQSTDQGDVLASSPDLVAAVFEFTGRRREYLLEKALEPLEGVYTHIIIDTPPSLGILTVNALTAAHDVVIPLEASVFSLQGLGQLSGTIRMVQGHSNADLRIAGILINKFNPRAAAPRDVKEAIDTMADKLKTRVYTTAIRQGVAVQEAQLERQSIYTKRRAGAAADFAAFVKEYISQEVET